ncbi:hypothetical protein F5J12DRAFT_888218 [Pisolithus orientalis]|uniref:uncharacterized protein n=1 Tax=Pisolithus orientalis TaxID=936130 RepID=UPI002224953E|nr:uncharacterized protein F5J12DRAFT_888218 [Pisolithus orientalis]KAI6030416.1 hypothetical protein F5J12DRAFT_888218 [Pisolithus orientalis]
MTSHQASQMDYIPSVSRSSGTDKDGDSLKDFRVQEAYLEFINGKLTVFWEECLSEPVCQNESAKRKRVESQTNVLILFRKLREGLLSSGRNDQFALEGSSCRWVIFQLPSLSLSCAFTEMDISILNAVYETSLYLSIMFESSVGMLDTTSILARLVPGMYTTIVRPLQSSQSQSTSQSSASLTAILMLLHTLVITYPSQRAYFDTLKSIPECILDRKSETYGWVRAVARCLGRCDFVEFEKLMRGSSVFDLVASVGGDSKRDSNIHVHSTSVSNSHLRKTAPNAQAIPSRHTLDLARTAFRVLLSRLRAKARGRAWVVFRSAYREISEGDEVKRWLERYLALESVEGVALEGTESVPGTGKIPFDEWIRERERDGHIGRKEGAVGKWVVCKLR